MTSPPRVVATLFIGSLGSAHLGTRLQVETVVIDPLEQVKHGVDQRGRKGSGVSMIGNGRTLWMADSDVRCSVTYP